MLKKIRLRDAAGVSLAHDITEIRPGEFKGPAFRKGHTVCEGDFCHLERLGKNRGPDDADMRGFFESHLAQLRPWLAERENMDVFFCHYNDLMGNPATWVSQTAAFLDMVLDEGRMLAAVDTSLYRNRSQQQEERT